MSGGGRVRGIDGKLANRGRDGKAGHSDGEPSSAIGLLIGGRCGAMIIAYEAKAGAVRACGRGCRRIRNGEIRDPENAGDGCSLRHHNAHGV